VLVGAWSRLPLEPDRHVLVLAGLGNDAYSNSIRRIADRIAENRKILLLPFLNHVQVNSLLNASDATVWPTVSIGMQQALACGCFLLVASNSSGTFILNEHDDSVANGLVYHPNVWSLGEAIEASGKLTSIEDRLRRALRARQAYSLAAFDDWFAEMLEDFS